MRHAQDGPPLPASLRELRLRSNHPVDIRELARGDERLTAATESRLIVITPTIRCSLAWAPSRTALPAHRLVSQLPAGFRSFAVAAQWVTVDCSAAPKEPLTAAAASELCLFFAHAPASYRHFCLGWVNNPLEIRLLWRAGYAEVDGTVPCSEGRATFDGVRQFVRQLRNSAAALNMSVAYYGKPAKVVVVTRL